MDNRIGSRLKMLRETYGYKQQELCDLMRRKYGMNTNRVTISKWERAEQMPETNALRVLAQIFNVSIDYMACLSDDPKKREQRLSCVASSEYSPFADMTNDAYGDMSEENVAWRKLHYAVDQASGAKRELIGKVIDMTDEQAAAWNAVIK